MSEQSTLEFRRGENVLAYREPKFREVLAELKIPTERLLLRPIIISDAENVFREFTRTVARYMTPSPAQDTSETQAFLRGAVNDMWLGTDLQLVIEDRETRQFLGLTGLHSRFGGHTPEIGIWLKASAQGRGLGREAVHGLLKWAQEHMTLEHIVYPVAEENERSREIIEELGGTVHTQHEANRSWSSPLQILVYHLAVPPSRGDRQPSA